MIVFLGSAATLTLIILLYRKRMLMALPRTFSLVALVLLITGFALPLPRHKHYELPIMLIDLSMSMKEHYPAVFDLADNVTFSHKVFFFHETLLVADQKRISPTGRFTDIVSAVREADTYDPEAIILLSDGNHNYGNPTRQHLEKINVPVYAFGIGTVGIRDASIIDITYPSYAFAGDSLYLEVTTQSQGFATGTCRLTVLSSITGDRRTSSVPLSDALAKHTTRIPFVLSRPGRYIFKAQLSNQPVKTTPENNAREFIIDVLEQKIQLLYYTEHPSFTSKFTLHGLRKDIHVNLHAVMKQKNGKFVNMQTYDEEPLPPFMEYDVVILDNINLATLPWHNPETFFQAGRGVLIMGKIEGFAQKWYNILPIPTHGLTTQGTFPLSIAEPFSCLRPGEEYPPLSSINRVSEARENSLVIAATGRTPVIAYRKHLNGLVFQINTDDLGTWHFMQMGMKQYDVLGCLIGDIVRFLSTLNIHTRLALRSLRNSYAQGETVELTLQSYDRNFVPAAHGDFYALINDKKVPFFESSPGNYRTSFTAEEPGQFQVKAAGNLGEESMESNELKIAITRLNIERAVGLNSEFLQTVAKATNGSYHTIDELKDFDLPARPRIREMTYLSFDSPLIYLLIFALLTSDWLLRRRGGMI